MADFKKLIFDDGTEAYCKDEYARNEINNLQTTITNALSEKLDISQFETKVGATVQEKIAELGQPTYGGDSNVSTLSSFVTQSIEQEDESAIVKSTELYNNKADKNIQMVLENDKISVGGQMAENAVMTISNKDVSILGIKSFSKIVVNNNITTITEKFFSKGINNEKYLLSYRAESINSITNNGISIDGILADNKIEVTLNSTVQFGSQIVITYVKDESSVLNLSFGENNINNSVYGIAQGYRNKISGNYSLASGKDVEVQGYMAQGFGEGIKANGDYSHVFGRNNIEDTENKYIEIVGNGIKNLVDTVETYEYIQLDNSNIINTKYKYINNVNSIVYSNKQYDLNKDSMIDITFVSATYSDSQHTLTLKRNYKKKLEYPLWITLTALNNTQSDIISFKISPQDQESDTVVEFTIPAFTSSKLTSKITGISNITCMPYNDTEIDKKLNYSLKAINSSNDFYFYIELEENTKTIIDYYCSYLGNIPIYLDIAYTYNKSNNYQSNARTLDWYGNEEIAGDLTVGGSLSFKSGIKFYSTNSTHDQLKAKQEFIIFNSTILSSGVYIVKGSMSVTTSTNAQSYTLKVFTTNTQEAESISISSTKNAKGILKTWFYLPNDDYINLSITPSAANAVTFSDNDNYLQIIKIA